MALEASKILVNRISPFLVLVLVDNADARQMGEFCFEKMDFSPKTMRAVLFLQTCHHDEKAPKRRQASLPG
jgi:hypothetical protein